MKKQDEEDNIPKGYARVTEILMPYKDFSGIAPTVLDEAAKRGSLAHDFCELYALNMLIETPPPNVKNYVDSFIRWFDTYVEKVHSTEQRLNHSKYKISGKYDMIVQLKGSSDLVLLDIKTPQTADQTWILQTAAYKLMLRELKKIDVQRRMCLMLPKDGSDAKVVEYTEHERDERLFINQVEIYRFFNG